MTKPEVAVHAIGVKNLPTADLHANPHNPRMLFDRDNMTVLRQSIDRVGILVPLTVYSEKRTGQYRILDGQRRWMCAQELGLAKVPVNEVAEPTLVQNIVTMFQIHKLRLDWELMPTALKLELLMEKLKDKSERRLAEMTGLDEAVVVRCKKLLSYPKHYQDQMLDADPDKRVKADFFIELYPVRTDRFVNKFDWFNKDRFTDAMLKKHESKALKAVTEFRVVKQHITNAVRANRIGTLSKRMREFTEKVDLGSEHLSIEPAEITANARKLQKAALALTKSVEAIDVAEWYGENSLWDQLEALAAAIRRKLKESGRRPEK
jgi:ParB family chromosome partitioning protein